jgi:hypothetical protein
MATKNKSASRAMVKSDFEALAEFRYRLRLFLRFSEDVCNASGITPLQCQLLLQTKGYPGRQWASITELAERLQAKHHGVVSLPDFVVMPVLAPIQAK